MMFELNRNDEVSQKSGYRCIWGVCSVREADDKGAHVDSLARLALQNQRLVNSWPQSTLSGCLGRFSSQSKYKLVDLKEPPNFDERFSGAA